MRVIRPASLIFYAILTGVLGPTVAFIGGQTVSGGVWLGLVPVAVLAWRAFRIPIRRWHVARQAFPAPWHHWLTTHVPFYRDLAENDRTRFERDVQFLVDELTFEAVDGVETTDTLRLSVAAGGALLLHGRPDWEMPSHRTILFYPDRFDEDYYDSTYAIYDGMVHAQGPLFLSVKAVETDWARPGNGHNVVLHELAHLFDFEHQGAEGVPSLMNRASAAAWRTLVRREMRRVRLGRSLLRRYAATNPAEFFAVAVENFFDRPHQLKQHHPGLFDALKAFFNLDPRPGHVGESRMDAVSKT